MKYILNTGRYAVAFIIQKNKKEFRLELDKRRLYLDTGNVASTGITPVTEEDLEELKKQAFFNDLVKKGSLSILEEDEVKSPSENKLKKLEEENQRLQEELKKAEKPDVKKIKDENKTLTDENKVLSDENANLKAQLEALTKAQTKAQTPVASEEDGEKADDTEGF